MLFFVTAAQLFFSSFFFKLRKISSFITIVSLSYIAASVSLESYPPDYLSYSNAYYKRADVFEPGYKLLSDFFLYSGFNYDQFRLFLFFSALSCIFIGVIRFTKNVSYVFLIYIATLFAMDVIQVRNFLMLSLVVLGYSFFLRKTIPSYAIGILITFIGAQFHSLGYIFFFSTLLTLIKVYKLKKALVPAIPAVFLISFLQSNGILNLQKYGTFLISDTTQENNLETAITVGTATLSSQYFVYNTLTPLLILCIVIYALNIKQVKNDASLDNTIRVILPLIYLCLFSVALLSLSYSFLRLQRDAFIFFYIFIACIIGNKLNSKKLLLLSMVSLLAVFIFYTHTWPSVKVDDRFWYIIHAKESAYSSLE